MIDKKNEDYFSKRILNFYERKNSLLPDENKAHFFSRAFKVTRSQKHENFLAESFYFIKLKSIKNSLKELKGNKINYVSPVEIKSERQRKRVEFYKKNPKICFFNELLNDLFFIYKYKLDRIFLKQEIKEINEFLAKENFKKMYVNKEAILKDNSFTINAVFYLKYLGICDFTKDIVKITKEIYFNDKMKIKRKMSRDDFKSFIYSLTHIIIADSRYYNRYVSDYNWIINFFANEIDLIIEKTTLDIISEVGLCFKLTKTENRFKIIVKKIKDHITKEFNIKILDKRKNLIKKEHSSSIIALLFANKKMFFNGPNLSKNKLILNLINKEKGK